MSHYIGIDISKSRLDFGWMGEHKACENVSIQRHDARFARTPISTASSGSKCHFNMEFILTSNMDANKRRKFVYEGHIC